MNECYVYHLKMATQIRWKYIRIAAILYALLLIYLIVTLWRNHSYNAEEAFRRKFPGNVVPVLQRGLGNFEPKNEDSRPGPGENGEAHHLRKDQKFKADKSVAEYGINVVCSDEISLNRTIPDSRMEECRHWNYPTNLPTASVVIVFRNEPWSVLLRTVYSVINRSPGYILEEVVLVDDFSDKTDLKKKLEIYITRFNGRVRLVRNEEREGLIRARSRGAREAVGEVVIFLDAHCEVNKNWLAPLLAPIYRNKRVLTVPIIDGIDYDTLKYALVYRKDNLPKGIFEWGLLYKEINMLDSEVWTRKYKSEPYMSPTHAGGLFAINREYFLELGAYDPGLLIWGGENYELSFKVWQCGGRVEWVPCSRVGHIYRGPRTAPDPLPRKFKGQLTLINYKRVVETWFDDKYKEFFYTRRPSVRSLDMGDISEQLAIKQRMHCKNFTWYMENVAYDVLRRFPELPPNAYFGALRCIATKQCLDPGGQSPPSPVGLYSCHGYEHQIIRLNTEGQLGSGEWCLDEDSSNKLISLQQCESGTVNGSWVYQAKTLMMYHKTSKRCMTLLPQTSQLRLMPCDNNNNYQKWSFNL